MVQGGYFFPESSRLFEAMALYDLRTVRGVPVMGHLQIAGAAQRRERLPQLSMMFLPRQGDYLARSALTPRQKSRSSGRQAPARGAPAWGPPVQD